ncbi:hypothetical protein BDE36_2539 [Arcticibacter tournemirensis]|uniref:Uncharacterized protein n=1 Tax=Arcticibacter tournemirensis TaxID=699437 RepID=A0A5M9GMX2_9SPHI|nr:DUF6266 family protein [Arcticibacter tournemirensis]KAA8475680.1 hypothetical protein F1649_21300 [Arcticibacter tournemirensis]TQM50777.1 hypothetical protein BDE36_2539 [Arcticibacter tournemirensis]
MGNFLKGVLGGFSGKIGNVIGSSWKGIDYMRSLPRKTLNNATQEQLVQRLKFSCAVNFVKPISALVSVGFKSLAKQKITGYNVAIQKVLMNAISGDFPDYAVDFAKVQISEGTLISAMNPKAQSTIPGTLDFKWTNNADPGNNAHNDDTAIVLVYNPSKGRYLFNFQGAKREEELYSFALPENFSNDEVHAYMGFISRDRRIASNSEYLGKVVVF